ncbi:MAG: COX aromatic rich motif-containing protein [bacterium]|nr:COX aromatic rich motif-containing protein [bacterium]
MPKRKKEKNQKRAIVLTVLGSIVFSVVIAWMLRGANIPLFQPKGMIAAEQYRLLMSLIVLLTGIAVPVVLVMYLVVWKYRNTNTKSEYDPNAGQTKPLIIFLWAFPGAIAIIVGLILWPATHRLEPRKAISSSVKPMTIQVIAMRWKWLFIYPDQKIASVNFAQIPVNTPVEFQITADESPMSSFWIPNLGGQLYAMTGHINRLNLIANETGDFQGSTPEINGAGFSSMRFIARSSTTEEFDQWVQNSRQSSTVLDTGEYQKLLAPSEKNEVAFYASVDENIYADLINKYMGSHGHEAAPQQYDSHEEGH